MVGCRDKAIKLTKAEATIAKYQTKIEEMAALRNQVCVCICVCNSQPIPAEGLVISFS